MFGHDKDDSKNDNELVQPVSTKPVNEDFLGIDNTSDDASSDDASDSPSDDVTSDTTSTAPDDADDAPTVTSGDDLLDIKRQALQELSPLVDHLEQSPEEKFKTTMMLIQASDDKSLVPVAYAAAKKISDDKVRAQALLDIINEINYFTQAKN